MGHGRLVECVLGCKGLVAQVSALDSALARHELLVEWRPVVWEEHMEAAREGVVWDAASWTVERPNAEWGAPVEVAWGAGLVVGREMELRRFVVSAQGSRGEVQDEWKCGPE